MKTHAHHPIQLGDPVERRGVVIAPLFPRTDPRAEYLTLDEAIPLGFHVTELDAAGSVPELLAKNPLDANVLLYDGEELLGAKQNRILNVTVLVPARSETKIPVSCVEEGRWHARSAHFAPGAQADIYRAKPTPDDVRGAFPLVPGQSGALLALGDRFCLDYVSRPDAFARLYPKLLEGYLLDAREHAGDRPAEWEAFLERTLTAPRSRRASAGLGEDVRLAADNLVGSGLELDGELVQLCAFSSDTRVVGTRITPPSSRV